MKSAANSRLQRSFESLRLPLLLFSTIAFLTVQLRLYAQDNSDNWTSSIREANKASLVFISGKVTHKNGDVAPFAGTGFIVSSAGYVLTCNHVIPEYDHDVDTLQCSGSVGGRSEYPYPLTIVDSEKQGDLMLLILPQEETWPSVRSMAKWQLDSEVVVLGFPKDTQLLAAPGRITSVDNNGRLITNSALNHGMSGGPAFNRSGAIIGIAEGGYEEANSINLLIPISFATSLLQKADSPMLSFNPLPKDPILLSVVGVALFALVLVAIYLLAQLVQKIAAKGNLTFDLKDVLGQSAKDLEINYKSLKTVDSLLHKIYESIRSRVAADSYGEEWTLRSEESRPLYILGSVWAQLFNKEKDYRHLSEVGMKPGMKFVVERHEQPRLFINVDPKAGMKTTIKEVRYEDIRSVDGLLNMIGNSVLPTETSGTYGDKWVLRDVTSGETLDDIGPEWAKRNKSGKDCRNLAEAGMPKNVRLHVLKIPHSDSIDTPEVDISRPEAPPGPPPPKLGRRPVWDQQIWDGMDKAVRSAIASNCVARKVFPSTILGNVQWVDLSRLNAQDLTTEHLFRQFIEISREFVLHESEVPGEGSQHTGRTIAIEAAKSVANAEDALLFLGPSAIPLLDGTGVTIRNGEDLLAGFAEEALTFPMVPIPPSPTDYMGNLEAGVAAALASLNKRDQPGPYALFLSPNRYVQTFFPRPGLLKTPGENIKHLLTGGLHSVRILPEDVAILVSLAGDSVNILFGIDATTAFTNRDEQGGYHFRVFEQIQCAVRDARAFQCLIFG